MGHSARGGADAARIVLTLAGLAAILAGASPAAAICGDGTVQFGEECDDGNTAAADGCSPACRFEQLCVVTQNTGSPGSAAVVELGRDGSLDFVTAAVLPSPHSGGPSSTVTRCGRFVYVLNGGNIEGFDVALDGTLTPLPSVAPPTASAAFRDLICNEDQELLFALGFSETAILNLGAAFSYQVGAGGGLTLADTVATAWAGFVLGIFPDLHPTTEELYVLSSFDPPTGFLGDSVWLQRIAYSGSGVMTLAQSVDLATLVDGITARGMRITRDAGFLGIPGLRDPAIGPTQCFAHYDAPGVTIPPPANLHVDCSTLPENPTGFEVGPAGTPVFYYQSAGGDLQAVQFSGAAITTQASISPTHETHQLLLAYGGEALVSLGPAELATYEIAGDLVTLTPADQLSYAPSTPDDAVLIACPALGPPAGPSAVPLPTWLPALLAPCLGAIPVFLSARRRRSSAR